MSRAVVIGAGVIGLACAYELRRRGEQVVVLDKGAPGAACSSGNAGWVAPSLSGPVPAPGLLGTSLKWLLSRDSPLYIRPRADLEFLRWLWDFRRHCTVPAYEAALEAVARLNARTLALYDALEADGVRVETHRQGVLFAFLDPHTLEHVHADLERTRRFGFGVSRVLRGPELRDAEPMLSQAVVGGILAERERHVRPETLTSALVERLRTMGADVRPGQGATGFRRRGGTLVAARTAQGEVEADRFVVAAGAWSGLVTRWAGYRLPMQAGKGYTLTLANPRSQPRRPVYLDEARIAVSNFQGALRLAGTMELSGLNADLDPRRIAAIRRGADRYLLGWREAEREETWVGMRPMLPDGLPVIGRVPACDNLFIAAGHAMHGVGLAPATAAALAELMVAGRSSVDLSAFDPARFTSRRPHAPVRVAT